MEYGDEVSIVEESFRVYWGNSDLWLFYVISIVFVMLSVRTKEKRIMFGWYAILVMFVIVNPVLSNIIQRFVGTTVTYIRVYYLLPIVFTIAYVGTELVFYGKKTLTQAGLMVFLCIVLAFAGESYYEKHAYIEAENIYKIPQEPKVLADTILEDVKEDETVYVLAVLWDETWYYIRQYAGQIVATGNALAEQNYHDQGMPGKGEVEPYLEYMDQAGYQYDYVIMDKVPAMMADYERIGHTILVETEHYAVVKINREEDR